MKKILSLALGLALFVSCSSDDSDSINESQLTNKKWYAVSFKVLGQTIPADTDFPECGREYIMFKTGGVFASSYFTEDCQEFIENGSWVLDGKTVATNQDGSITNAKIKKLTATELIVTSQEDFDEDGKPDTITLTMTSK